MTMDVLTTKAIAIKMIIALHKEGLINEATFQNILKKYKEANT